MYECITMSCSVTVDGKGLEGRVRWSGGGGGGVGGVKWV